MMTRRTFFRNGVAAFTVSFAVPAFLSDLARAQGRASRNLVVLDLRNEETIYATNRFMIYALYPQCNISIHAMWGLKKQNTVFATGKSIIDRGLRK